MAWKQRNVMEQRISFVIRAAKGNECFSRLCGEFGISRPTGYLWRGRFEKLPSVLSLKEKSRRPLHCPHKTKSAIEKRVVELRKEFNWGARKLRVLLKDNQSLDIPERTINRILDRHGLILPENRINTATKRFQRDEPNQLWQMDFKGEFKNANLTCFPLTLLDDHSRFSLGIHALRETKTDPVDKCLIKTFENYGIPDAMLMDHGSPWWSNHSEHGITRLAIKLIKQGITLCYSGVGHPQTQGKLERFHRTLKQEVTYRGKQTTIKGWQEFFNSFRETYNNIRPHEALGMSVPASKYRPSTKQYNPEPQPWEYPTGSIITSIDVAGCLRHQGKQLFVCHALEGEKVRIQEIRHSLIVTYRHMIIREIDLQTGIGTAFPTIKV